MSATMNLLKGKGKAAAAPAEEIDAELAAPATVAEPDGSEDDSQEGVEDNEDPVETELETEGEAPAVAIPTSKTEVHALKLVELPAVHEAMGSPITGFDTLDLKGKKQAILDHLFPKGKPSKSVIAGSDTLTQISNEIENLKTRGEIEDRLQVIIQAEGENFFRKGGLLVKLSEIGDFGEHANLQEYILANGIAKDYRTARYWMSIYTGLLEAGIPYSDVEGIGWTKIVVILPVLTKENLEEWMAKAKALNVATLQATVDAALATGDSSGGTTVNSGEIKSMVFKFHKDQTDTANDALAKAKKAAGTESKEVAADMIFTEYLAVSPNKGKAAAPVATGPAELTFDPDQLDPIHVKAFFDAIAARYPEPKDAMGFLFSGPEEDNPDDKGYFELIWPTVDIDLNIPY